MTTAHYFKTGLIAAIISLGTVTAAQAGEQGKKDCVKSTAMTEAGYSTYTKHRAAMQTMTADERTVYWSKMSEADQKAYKAYKKAKKAYKITEAGTVKITQVGNKTTVSFDEAMTACRETAAADLQACIDRKTGQR